MKRFGTLLLAGLIPLAFAACQRETDTAVLEKLDEISARVEKLESGSGGAARGNNQPQRRPNRPDPDAVYAVPVGDSPQVGPDDAPVTVVEAFEFACPFCYRVHPTIKQLIEEYGDDIRVVRKNFLVHPQQATTPALAACAADQQGKYSEMRDLIWEKGFNANRNLGEDNMKKLAGEVGLDMEKFEADMSGDDCKQQLQEDMQLLRRVGTRGTPNFYINGRPLSGARPIEQFKALIDEELEKAEKRIADGTPAAEYYAKFVVEQGKESL